MFLCKPVRIVACVVLLFLSLYIVAVERGIAEENGTGNGNADTSIKTAELVQEIDTINKNIRIISAAQSDQVAEEFGVSVEDIEKRLLDLRELKSSYERLLTSLSALDKIEKDKLSIEERYENYRTKGMAEKPSYTLTLLDSVHEELSTAERNRKNTGLTVELLRKEIVEHNDRLKAVEKELRHNEEKLASTEGREQKQAHWKVDASTILLRHFTALVQAKKNEIQKYELEQDLTTLQIALLKEQTAVIKANVAYDDNDLKHQLASIQQKKDDLQKENQRLRTEQEVIERKWLKAQQDIERAPMENQTAIAEAYLKSRNEWRKTYQVALELNEKASLLMDRQMIVWQKRYALVNGDAPTGNLKELLEEIEKDIESLGQTLQIQQNYLVNLQTQMSSIESRLEAEGVTAPIQRHFSDQLNAIRKQLERRLEYQSIILAVEQVERRLLSEIETSLGQLTVRDHLTDIKEEFVDFWNIEIWAVDNQPVTLRKVAMALIILMVGMIVAKFILALVRTRFLLKSQFKETTASAVHKILSYSAYLLVCLFALRMVNIPLTAFAFLGGAVAIGIGFGAQNLINNFISGFIILGERPINIGDLIEVDGVLGMVEEIGARCTRVRTGENIHILVPNSAFLEKNITNWTLSDKKIRTNIVVGVSYGSPVHTVREKLIQAVKQVQRILNRPEPFVLFSEFGDNALIFHVYFWVQINRVIERRQIESDVRFKIDELFAQEGLVIAFPQRDVHLDTLSPLKVTLESKPIEN